MKILLVGDYSGVHSELAKGLRELNHEVVVISGGDGYKNFPRDIDIPDLNSKKLIFKLYILLLDFLGVKGFFSYLKHRKKISSLVGFDVVQLINPIAFPVFGSLLNTYIIRNLSKNNKSLFLCALGDDYEWVNQNMLRKFKYSALDRMTWRTAHKYVYSLRYRFGFFFRLNHRYTINKVKNIIPGLEDYALAYKNESKVTEIVRIPISRELIDSAKVLLEKLEGRPLFSVDRPIKIFHGWQKGKDYRKGNDILDIAVSQVECKYGKEYINYQIVSGLPYDEYIKTFDNCDIFLDQIYSYDRGVNALLGMANGKVVLSGYEKEKNKDSNVSSIGINAVPDITSVIKSFEDLLSDPVLIHSIKINSLKYVISNHDPKKVGLHYLRIWND